MSLSPNTANIIDTLVAKLDLPQSETEITKVKIAELLEVLLEYDNIEAIEEKYGETLDEAFAGLSALAHSASCESFENILYSVLSIPGLSSDRIKAIFELLQEHQLLREEALDFERMQQVAEEFEVELTQDLAEDEKEAEAELEHQKEIDAETLNEMREAQEADFGSDLDDILSESTDSPLDDIVKGVEQTIEPSENNTQQQASGYSDSLFEPLTSKEEAAANSLTGSTDMFDHNRSRYRNAMVFKQTIHGKGAPDTHAAVVQIDIDKIYQEHFGKRDPNTTEVESKKLDYEFENPNQGIVYPAPILTRTIQKAIQLTAVRLSGNKDASPTSTPDAWEKSIELVNALNPMNSEDTREKFLENRRDVLHAMSLISKYQNALANGQSVILSGKEKTTLSHALNLSPDAVPANLNTRVLNTLDDRAQELNKTQTMLEFAVMQDECPEMAGLICELYLLNRPADAKAVFNDVLGFARPHQMAQALAPANMADLVIKSEMESPFHTPTPADNLPGASAGTG